MTNNQIRIGKIVGCHGIRGDLKLRPASEAEWIGTLREITLQASKTKTSQNYRIQKAWKHGNLVLVHLEGVDTRNAAELLIDAIVLASREDLPEPDEGEYWADQLIGLKVVDAQTGRQRGTVKDLLSSSGQDYLEIKLEDSTETAIIPFQDHFFPEVDLEQGQITVDLLGDFLSVPSEPVTSERLEE
jgi:16S rRNA processing protein RimM